MAAPKGNKFWLVRSSHGRKPIFETPEKLWDAACQYFEWVEKNPLWETKAFAYQGDVAQETLPKMRAMTQDGLLLFIDISQQAWSEYRQREGFGEVTQRIDQVIRSQKFAGAAADLLNANIIARDLGLRDNINNEIANADGKPFKTESNITLSPDEAYKRMLNGS